MINELTLERVQAMTNTERIPSRIVQWGMPQIIKYVGLDGRDYWTVGKCGIVGKCGEGRTRRYFTPKRALERFNTLLAAG